MNAVIPFSYGVVNIRAVEIDGASWFVGRDIAAALGYANPQKAVRDHCKSPTPVGVNDSFTPGLDPQTVIINEPDLYRLVASSQLPEAEHFEKWVFEEVLPAIRKTGSYLAINHRMPKSDAVRDLLRVTRAVSYVKGVDPALAMAYGLDLIETTTGLPVTGLRRALPSVMPEDQAGLNATQIGKPLGLSARAVNAVLTGLGLLERDESGQKKLTEAGVAHGEAKPFHRNGHSGYEIRWKPSISSVISDYLRRSEVTT